MPTTTATIHMKIVFGWNEWLMTKLPIFVEPVRSAEIAASCVPFAGRKYTPIKRWPHRDDQLGR